MWCWSLLVALLQLSSEDAEKVLPLARFPDAEQDIVAWLEQSGFESQRQSPKRCEVGHGMLRLRSAGDSVALGKEFEPKLSPEQWPRLRFRFRVEQIPTGTDLRRKAGDDAAFRLFVAFDRGAGLLHPPHTLAYTWTEDVLEGTLVQSPHFDQVRYLSIGRGLPPTVDGDPRAGWVTIDRDLQEDYRLAFPEAPREVPLVRGILLKCDSNDTRTEAAVSIECVELHPAMLSSPASTPDRPGPHGPRRGSEEVHERVPGGGSCARGRVPVRARHRVDAGASGGGS